MLGTVYTYIVGIIRKIPELVLIVWLKLFELLKKQIHLKLEDIFFFFCVNTLLFTN